MRSYISFQIWPLIMEDFLTDKIKTLSQTGVVLQRHDEKREFIKKDLFLKNSNCKAISA